MKKPTNSTEISRATDGKQTGKKPEMQPSTHKPQNTEQGQTQKSIEQQ